MNRFKDKAIVITGGAGSIGKETAKHYVDEGAKVMLVDLDENALKNAKEEIGNNVEIQSADVADSSDVEAYVNAAKEKFGKVDAFFNNAAIEGDVKPLDEYPETMFDKVMMVNVKGMWLGLKYMFPVMKEQGHGSIVISSSVAGLQGSPNVVAYVTSKHALVGMMRTAALEGGPHGIRVNSIHPSPIDNRMMRSLEKGFSGDDPEAAKKQFEQSIPMGRYGKPEEVARLVLFLSSDESGFINGGTFTVDGGMTV